MLHLHFGVRRSASRANDICIVYIILRSSLFQPQQDLHRTLSLRRNTEGRPELHWVWRRMSGGALVLFGAVHKMRRHSEDLQDVRLYEYSIFLKLL